jgi:hypothetical protein
MLTLKELSIVLTILLSQFVVVNAQTEGNSVYPGIGIF